MSCIVKNQHYGPQVYLRGFAKKNGKEYKLCVYDKEKNSIRENQNVQNIIAEGYFYDFEYDKIVDFEKLKKLKEGD